MCSYNTDEDVVSKLNGGTNGSHESNFEQCIDHLDFPIIFWS